MKGAPGSLASRMLKMCRKPPRSWDYLRNKQRVLHPAAHIRRANWRARVPAGRRFATLAQRLAGTRALHKTKRSSDDPQAAPQTRNENSLGMNVQSESGAFRVKTFVVGQQLPVPQGKLTDR